MDVRENAIRSIAQADGDGLQPAARYVVDALDAARAEVAALRAENERLNAFVDDAHGIICNAHQKRVDDVTNDDGASPGWAEAARRWIDAYPFTSFDATPAGTGGKCACGHAVDEHNEEGCGHIDDDDEYCPCEDYRPARR